jgi:hypothetical protein
MYLNRLVATAVLLASFYFIVAFSIEDEASNEPVVQIMAQGFVNQTAIWQNAQKEIFVADNGNYRIAKMDNAQGTITTYVGAGISTQIQNDGNGDHINLESYDSEYLEIPIGMIYSLHGDMEGNIYYADYFYNKINKITPDNVLTIIAGLPFDTESNNSDCNLQDGAKAFGNPICNPWGVFVDSRTNDVYFSEINTCRVWRIDVNTKQMQLVAGNGKCLKDVIDQYDEIPAKEITLDPRGIAIDHFNDNTLLFVCSANHNRVFRFYQQDGGWFTETVFKLEEGGMGYSSLPSDSFYSTEPMGISSDGQGNIVVSTIGDCRLIYIDYYGKMTSIAGNGSCANITRDISVESQFVPCYGIFMIDIENMIISGYTMPTIMIYNWKSGDYDFEGVWLQCPTSLYLTSLAIYVGDPCLNAIVIFPSNEYTPMFFSDYRYYPDSDGQSEEMAVEKLYIQCISAITGDVANSDIIYISDDCGNMIYQVNIEKRSAIRVGGIRGKCDRVDDGFTSFKSPICNPRGLTFYKDYLYYIDGKYCTIRKFLAQGGEVKTVVGNINEGCRKTGSSLSNEMNIYEQLFNPMYMFLYDRYDGYVFISAPEWNALLAGYIESQILIPIAGNTSEGSAIDSMLNFPTVMTGDEDGNIYIYNSDSYVLQKIDLEKGQMEVFAGNGKVGLTLPGVQARETYLSNISTILIYNDSLLLTNSMAKQILVVTSQSTDMLQVYFPNFASQPSKYPTSSQNQAYYSSPFYYQYPTQYTLLIPSKLPTVAPSVSVSTTLPTISPTTITTSVTPSMLPSVIATVIPTAVPSTESSAVPSVSPTAEPSTESSAVPSVSPSAVPSIRPLMLPSVYPTAIPTAEPSIVSSAVPSVSPSAVPSIRPLMLPSVYPTAIPTAEPSTVSSAVPSVSPGFVPSGSPLMLPSVIATSVPSTLPTQAPIITLTAFPTIAPSAVPTTVPSVVASTIPSAVPSVVPTAIPTVSPSLAPTIFPTITPSIVPSVSPSVFPTTNPSYSPSFIPSVDPSAQPSIIPTAAPTTASPSTAPTFQPTYPLDKPFTTPTPSFSPSIIPSFSPSVVPTFAPTFPIIPAPIVTFLAANATRTTASLTIQIDALGKLYCGVFAAGIVPADGNVIRIQNQVATPEANVSVVFQFSSLQSLTSYSFYVVTEALSGTASSYSQILNTRTDIITKCCKQLSISLSNRYLIENQNYVNIIQLKADSTPLSTTLVISPILYYVYTNGTLGLTTTQPFVPSIWNLTALSSLTTQISIIGLSPGSYYIGLQFSGMEKPKYAVNSIFNDSSFQVVSSDTPLPAPKLLEVIFSNDGSSMSATFDTITDYGGLSTRFSCAALFDFACVSSSICQWVSTNEIEIAVTPMNSCVKPGDTLSLLASNQIRAACPKSTCSSHATWATSIRSNVIVQAPEIPTIPSLTITAPKTVGTCSFYTMDLTSSTGNGGRDWQNVTISVSSNGQADSSVKNSTMIIQQYLNNQFVFSPPLALSTNYFIPSYLYYFTVSMCNFLGACGVASSSVGVLDTAVPIVSIPGNSLITTTTKLGMTISASAKVSSCTGSQTTSSINSITWSASLNNIAVQVPSTSKNPYSFIVSSYVLIVGSTYSITVTASTGSTSSSTSVQVYVTQGSLVAMIAGSSQKSVRELESIIVDGSSSYDEDVGGLTGTAAGLKFSWSCSQSLPILSSSCAGVIDQALFVSNQASQSELLNALENSAGAVISVTLTVSDQKSTRSASTSITISVLSSLSPTVALTSNGFGNNMINAGSILQLIASANIPQGLNGNASWSLGNSLSSSLQSIALTPLTSTWSTLGNDQSSSLTSLFYLSIKSYALAEGLQYTFSFGCYPSSVGQATVSSIVITVNKAPSLGKFQVSPSEGIELEDIFTFSCSNWIDSNLPLTYQFSYLTTTGTKMIVKSSSQATYTSLVLPAGSSSNKDVVNCIADIYDVYNANTTVQYQVVVHSQPTLTFAAQSDLIAQSLSSLSSSSSSGSSTIVSADEVKQNTAIVSYLLNKVNCSLAANCTAMNRISCYRTENTCGPCLSSDYIGIQGDDNSMCYLESDYYQSMNAESRQRRGLSHLSITDNSPAMSYFQNKECQSNCSGHGICRYRSSVTHNLVSNCSIDSFACYAECDCMEGYGGSATCSLTTDDWETKQSYRNSLILNLKSLIELEDVNTQSVSGLINSIVNAAQNPYELSLNTLELLIEVIESILYNVQSYQLPVSSMESLLTVFDSISSAIYQTTSQNATAASNLTSTMITQINSYLLYAVNNTVPGQYPQSSLQTNFRTLYGVYGSCSSETETSVSISLPTSGTDKILGQTPNQFILPSDCSVSGTGTERKIAVSNVARHVLSNDAADSDRMSLQLSSFACSSKTDGDCNINMTLTRNSGYEEEFYNTSQVITVCEEGEEKIVDHDCGNLVGNITIACTGNAEIVTSHCPSYRRAPSCASMTNLDSDETDLDCKTIGYTDAEIYCSCSLSSQQSRRKMTAAATIANGTDDGSGTISVSYLSLIEATATNFEATVDSASSLNIQTLQHSSQALIVLGSLLGAILIAFVFARHWDQQSNKISSEIVPATDSKSRALSSILKYKQRHKKIDKSMLKPEKAIQSKEEAILEMAKESLPGILSSKSWWAKIKEELKRHHRWFAVVFFYSNDFPRILRVASLASNVIIMLFMQSLTYNLTNNNAHACDGYTTQSACTSQPSPYRTGSSMCTWVSTSLSGEDGTGNTTGSCVLIEADTDMKVVIFVAIFSALVSTPLAMLTDYLICSILCAPAKPPINLKRISKMQISDRPKNDQHNLKSSGQQFVSVVPPNGSQVSSTRQKRNAIFTRREKAGADIASMIEELQCYYQSVKMTNDEKKEFRGNVKKKEFSYFLDCYNRLILFSLQ